MALIFTANKQFTATRSVEATATANLLQMQPDLNYLQWKWAAFFRYFYAIGLSPLYLAKTLLCKTGIVMNEFFSTMSSYKVGFTIT